MRKEIIYRIRKLRKRVEMRINLTRNPNLTRFREMGLLLKMIKKYQSIIKISQILWILKILNYPMFLI
jgi:hypothetical protein